MQIFAAQILGIDSRTLPCANMQIADLWKKIHKVRELQDAGYGVEGIVGEVNFSKNIVQGLLQTNEVLNSGAGHKAKWGDASPPREVAHTPEESSDNG
jgi:hypothetical protein